MLTILDEAPDFAAEGAAGRGEPASARLSDRRGRWVVLAFYPRDFTPVCPTEIRELSRRAPELAALGAEVLALSVDDAATHARWIREVLGEVAFPLLADPGGAIARAYGVLLPGEGVAARATFLVGPDGRIRHLSVHDLPVGRSVSEVLRVLEALQTGERTPAEWRPGDRTLGR